MPIDNVMNSRQRRAEYVTLFAVVDSARISVLKEYIENAVFDQNMLTKLGDLNDIAEHIVNAIEENGVLDGNL